MFYNTYNFPALFVLAAAFPLWVTGERDCMSHKLDPSVMLGRVRPEARFIALLPPVH
jgi:hypothetical protein